MRIAAEAVKRSMEMQSIHGIEIYEHYENRPTFTIRGIPFFKRNMLVHTEVRIPFEHYGKDNRKVQAAAQHKGLMPNQRLFQAIEMTMAGDRVGRKARGIATQTVEWHEGGRHAGYKIIIRK